jgi:hypothetical protein
MRLGRTLIASGAALALWPVSSRADRRAYGETYEAVTAPQGEIDVETWFTGATQSDLDGGPATRGFRGMLELEYGITERWDVALYNMLDMGTLQPGYAGFKIETRFRPSLPGQWFVDPVIYLEYQRRTIGDASDALELKVILAKDMGPWNFAVNVAGEVESLPGVGLNPELEYAVGVSREAGTPALKVGVEAFGKVERPPSAVDTLPRTTNVFVWVGPAVSWATTFEGSLRGLWITVAAGHGVTTDANGWYGRGIVGLQF